VSGLGSGAPGRETMTDETPRRGIGWRILAIVAIGLVFRLIMAYGFSGLRGSGFDSDLGLFRFWASNLADQGPFGFYDRGFFADYTPGYLYPLWLVGVVGQFLGGVGDLIKLPAILTDVALGYIVYRMARDLGVSERRATIAGAVVIVNPITWFDSVVWGQVDSFGTVFLLLSVRELWKARSERAAILAVVAALVKPQLAILVPIVAFVTIRRALWPKGGFGSETAPEPSGFGWERRTTGWIRIVSTGVAGFATAVLLSAPFGLSVVSFSGTAPFVDSSLVRLILSTASTYSYVTVNAYNLWALFPVDGQSMATNGGWIFDAPVPDATSWASIGPFPAAAVGGLLLAVLLFVVIPFIVARRPDRLTILVGVSVMALAFFAVPTRVHERYLFPLFALAAIPLAFSWRWRILYVVASVATFLNMYVVLTTIYPDNPSIRDWLGIGEAIRSQFGVTAIALANTAVFLWVFAQLRPAAMRTLEAELEHGRERDAWDEEAGPAPVGTGAPAGGEVGGSVTAGGAGATAAALPGSTPRRRLVPAWFDRPSWSDVGPIAWFRARIDETPIRPDRSASLSHEGRGRLDRLDLWLLIVLVVAAMGLRMFRLAEPARMHFDEVYHARTAAEFLQDWRYGISHYIYEWTHPHLAKYAMAGGIVLFAGHDTQATSDLGVPVRDAAIEPRRPDPSSTTARDGDRVWVATGSALTGYDLHTRKPVASWTVDGAAALAFDTDRNKLYVGTDGGELLALDLASLDGLDAGSIDQILQPELVATLDGPISRLAPFDDGSHVAAILPDDTVVIVDPDTGTETGRAVVPGAVDMAAAGSAQAIVGAPAQVDDPAAVAAELASILGGDAASFEDRLADTEEETVVVAPVPTGDVRAKLQTAIDDGKLPGISVDAVAQVAVAGTDGVTLLTGSGSTAATVDLQGPATGLALVTSIDDGSQLYVTTTDASTGEPQLVVVAVTGEWAAKGPVIHDTLQMPGPGTRVVFDSAAEMVEVLGTRQDGTGSTVYVVEPHGKSVFADQDVPFQPTAWVLDHSPDYPTANRGQILAFGANGETASLDIGDYAFAWRLPGVFMGAVTVGLLFLLARILFRRRSIAVLVALFALLDGMFFVQSRIAMNDVYVGAFILAAYCVFAWLWIKPERPRWAFWTLMPMIGVFLGLALASKWVAAYAIGALGILILARSALGRLLLIFGMIGLTGVLGWMAMAVPAGSEASGNLLFTLIMIALTLATVVVTIYHPIAWSDEEMWFAVAGPGAIGILIAFVSIVLGRAGKTYVVGPIQFTPLEVAFAFVLVGILAYAAFQVAARFGFGPMARTPEPGDPRRLLPPASAPATGWLRLGSGLGIPVVWMLGSLLAIPIVVYVITYIPWAFVEGHQIIKGWPPGHTGQTLLDLTGEMYRYHNDLTAPHPASSPWWAWPLNLKPVWFYQGSFANSTAASIYDAGNVILWWMGIPAMVFAAVQAFRRRSLPLALVLIGFLCQWISWARIDRAAFQYHYYTSLPFLFLALAYFIAELWHGPSRRTWMVARVAALFALFAPVILWLLRQPLCGLANVEAVNAGSQACNGNPGNLVVTPSAAVLAFVGIVTLIVLVKLLLDLTRPRDDGTSAGPRDLLPLAVTAVLGGVVIALAGGLPTDATLISINGIVPELIALLIAIPLALVGLQLITARDSRRFAAGFVLAAGVWFVVLYPNIAALPLPDTIVNAYQGLLPTYLYAFQFSVNTLDRSGAISFADARFVLLIVFLAVACAVVAYSTWVWRMAAVEEDEPAAGETGGPEGAPGAA
jgi:Dolichyl-phosphate-mannose-protein mannosyltransferase/C-terminal four TMM region of protein-O-mannosyltransferase